MTKSRRHDPRDEDNALPAEVEPIHWELSNTKIGSPSDNYVDRQRLEGHNIRKVTFDYLRGQWSNFKKISANQ